VLGTYGGSRDVVFGATVAGRPPTLPGADEVVGMFINSLPVRVEIDAGETVATWLRRLQERQVVLREYEYASLVDIQGWSAVPRDRRLFESILVFENYPAGVVRETSLTVDFVSAYERTGYPLTIVVGIGEQLRLIARYDGARFTDEAIERLLEHLRQALEQLAAGLTRPLDAIDIRSRQERRLLEAWNETTASYPDWCVHELVEEQARRTPDHPAVRAESGVLTYRELDERANRLARFLRRLGCGPEIVAGICMNHSSDLIVGLLAILKTGAAYLPLDPSHPGERNAFIVEDADALLCLTERACAEAVPAGAERTIVLEDVAAEVAREPSTPLPAAATPDNLIYVMYTSGSTGRPKGVLVHHRGVVNYLVWALRGYGLEGASGAPLLGSIAFDMTIPNLFLPLIGGKDVTILPPDRTLEALAELISRELDFSLLKITPGHLDVLRTHFQQETDVHVRTFVVGADELKAETALAWSKVAPGKRILNEYGPTETVVGCSVYVLPPSLGPGDTVPIGKPIANIRMYVVDERGEPVIGGDGVVRGYCKRPRLTAEKFVPDAFAATPGARLYRTGDLARFLPDGNVEFLGRADTQVKIRGYRIELAEIEAALLAHPEVSEAVAAAREDRPGTRHLVAYLVPGEGGGPTDDELRSFLERRLPDYMVPRSFHRLDRLPLSDGSKVDRRLLPAPSALGSSGASRPASTPAEIRMTAIWGRVLGVEEVGLDDDFFMLGGHSILATSLLAEIRTEFASSISLRVVFENPTPRTLLAAVEDAASAPRERLAPVPREVLTAGVEDAGR
jgi:amino acid adenylation domain-containing protein